MVIGLRSPEESLSNQKKIQGVQMGFLVKNVLIISMISAFAQDTNIQTLQQWSERVPVWGATWASGNDAVNGYYPSFYTGFAPRSQNAERIHVRTSRGNQTRVSVILDEQTVKDYLFDLSKRSLVYKQLSSSLDGKKAVVNTAPKSASLIPQMQYFLSIVDSPEYKVQETVTTATSDGSYDSANFYVSAIQAMEKLNPGRVFWIELDLKQEFAKWQARIQTMTDGKDAQSYFSSNPSDAIVAINSLVWGRVNYTQKPDAAVLAQLGRVAALAVANDVSFTSEAFELFKSLTGDKYNFQIVSQDGQRKSALACDESSCQLSYPEFTAIYPTGSAKSYTKDKFGNSIPAFATPGLWNFLDRGYHEVDNIRDEPYYGWAPKMDFEAIGNGFHNPAVRFSAGDLNKTIREKLNIRAEYNQFWSVKRGGVSSGCLRLPLGHVWEMRHIFPVENEKMKQVFFFGNNSQDFDLYDVDGDGTPEIMGVEYQISYDLRGASGLDKREGANLEVSPEAKEAFYKNLYGGKNVFEVTADGYQFINPSVSLPSHLDYQKKKTSTSFIEAGAYRLYEQKYEQDKVQMYAPYTTNGLTSKGESPLSKRIVRILGRVRGCAPSSDKTACGAEAFETELNGILKEIK